ncbi:MAG TPA: hypothetical protein VFU19_10820 [Iamia sp.]|nr:hypothetical protein [Iamia sp.]
MWLLVVFLAFLGLTVVVNRSMVGSVYDEMGTARWAPVAPGPEHAALATATAALVDEGYVVDSCGRVPSQPRSSPMVALVHPDGSTAYVMGRRGLLLGGPILVQVETEIRGDRTLLTTSYAQVAPLPNVLMEVAARRVDVAACVRRHRAARRLLHEHGVAVAAVRPGEVGAAIEAGMRRAAETRPAVSVLRVWGRWLTGGGRYRTPLAERPGITAELAAIAAEQAATGG